MKLFVVAALLTALLAGCASPAAPADVLSSEGTPAAPAPVAVDERLDLSVYGGSDSWSFTVGPGAKTAQVRFTLEGPEGLPVHLEQNQPCLSWNTDTAQGHKQGSSGSCGGAGNVQIALGGMSSLQPKVLLAWDLANDPGDYSFSISAPAANSVSVLHTVITVAY